MTILTDFANRMSRPCNTEAAARRRISKVLGDNPLRITTAIIGRKDKKFAPVVFLGPDDKWMAFALASAGILVVDSDILTR